LGGVYHVSRDIDNATCAATAVSELQAAGSVKARAKGCFEAGEVKEEGRRYFQATNIRQAGKPWVADRIGVGR